MDINNMDLEKLNLSVRAFNCLCRSGIRTIDQLCNTPRDDLLRIRNMGTKTLAEIEEKLAHYLEQGFSAIDPFECSEKSCKQKEYCMGAEAMRRAVLNKLRTLAKEMNGAQGAALDAACQIIESLEVI